MTMPLDAAVGIPEDVVFRELDGEAVILNLESGMYFGLDAVGTRIWQLLDTHRTLRKTLEALEAEYDVPPDRLKSDLTEFVDRLQSRGLLVISPQS
jgi:coenzyme PQQ synthesis protein D (PqqD)